ncbi:TetR/AcrR family transcriptional regulator, partial [Alloscardovia omnicolens]
MNERASVEMLSNRSPDDITVSSLTQHAGIHRKTFYLHFTSIDDVYEDYVQTLAHQYSEIIRDPP